MLCKTKTYLKSYDGKPKWMYFSIEDKELLKDIVKLGIK